MIKWVQKAVKKQIKKAEKNGVIGTKATKKMFLGSVEKEREKMGSAKVKKID